MHGTASEFIRAYMATRTAVSARRRVVEFGSRDLNGTVRGYFENSDYTGIDIIAGKGVDVVGNAAEYEPDGPVDIVVCVSVFEHTPLAKEMAVNAYKMLKHLGVFLVATVTRPCPEHSGYDGGPLKPGEFYQHVEPEMMVEFLKPFGKVQLTYEKTYSGDVFAIAQKIF